jgi:hypothetical protein
LSTKPKTENTKIIPCPLYNVNSPPPLHWAKTKQISKSQCPGIRRKKKQKKKTNKVSAPVYAGKVTIQKTFENECRAR